MNKAISLSKLIDEAAYLEDPNSKRLAGSITNSVDFERNRRVLQSFHRGLFSFVAFHPGVDASVAEYIEKGSIASDSGPNIMVLFYSAKDIRFPRPVGPKDLNIGVDFDLNIHPAYEFVQWLLPGKSVPAFPGLIFMDGVVDSIEAVYVPIAKHSTSAEVADFCRSVFALANRLVKDTAAGQPLSLDSFSVALKKSEIEYTRSGDASMGEWLVVAYQFSKKHGATIVSLIAKLAKAF
jgi:hypothetical protein